MSGPNDSGEGSAPAGGLRLTLPVVGAPPGPSDRFRLKIAWETPHLEWKPLSGQDSNAPGASQSPPPKDPPKAIAKANRYFEGQMLFDMRRPDWSQVDKAFLTMPEKPPLLYPKGEALHDWRNDWFFRGLSGAPVSPLPLGATPLPNLPMVPAQQSLFFKQPNPAAMAKEPGPPKAGSVGDLLDAIWNLPVVQRLAALFIDEAKRNGRRLEKEWQDIPTAGNVGVIAFGATLAGGAIAGVLGAQDSRKFAADHIRGVKIPIPFTPASLQINGFGPLTDLLYGQPTPQQLINGPFRSHEANVMLFMDMERAVKIIHDHL
jgi:hypothetical protein